MKFQLAVVGLMLLGAVVAAPCARASAHEDITSATAEGRAVFVVVTQAGARGTDRALDIARQAQALAPGSVVVTLDRGAVENAELVKAYRLAGAPVPLILVVAPNGVVAGGALLKDATPQVLVKIIPTPKKAEMLLHLTQGRPVFVVVSSRAMVEQRSAVFEACTQAVKQLERKAHTVVVDLEDKAEAAFVKELSVSPKAPAPVIVIYNAKGQKTQVFREAVTAEQLVEAVYKKVECCPGGSC